ncbi:prenyltransferase/squalene oxidase repeat-containing protein [Saccharothrix syringae]|uniref:Prenyltransferase n=1 Tax=Saccharothrix syringae TaxID=103733 RepID=A0A5Q0GWY2_SACSY|nr:hypothetical protein [Saccharothrix syringae]QFZ18616.1 hypothetical protein EKG83_15125 [Saccharothrix syringae]
MPEVDVRGFAPAFPGVGSDELAGLSTAATAFASSVLRGAPAAVEGYRVAVGLLPVPLGVREALRANPVWCPVAPGTPGHHRAGSPECAAADDVPLPARLRVAFARVLLVAMGRLGGAAGTADRLARSVEHLVVAESLVNGVTRWREDALTGEPSPVLALAARFAGLGGWPSSCRSAAEVDRLGRALHLDGVAAEALDRASAAVAAAGVAADGLPVGAWLAHVDLVGREITMRRGLLPGTAPRDAFPEGHVVTVPFPSGPRRVLVHAGPRTPSEHERSAVPPRGDGDLLARLLVANALVEVGHPVAGGGPDGYPDREVERLLAGRRPGRVLWACLPDVPDLPDDSCDVDVLAEVLRLLVGTGRAHALREEVEGALRWAFPTNGSPRGSGATDPGALANLLHAGLEFGADLPVERVLDRLCSAQSPDGGWVSGRWPGTLHGTRACMRVIGALRGRWAPPVELGARHVLAAQLPDGGWARAGGRAADPLSTAVALLALAEAPGTGPVLDAAAAGIGWLRDPVRSHAGFPATHRPDAAAPGSTDPTAVLVRQAAVRWNRLG